MNPSSKDFRLRKILTKEFSKGQKIEVKEFAAKMVAAHTANNAKLDALEAKMGVTRTESAQSEALKKSAEDLIAQLKNTADESFDKTYIDSQVMMHQELLTSMDQTLIPAAQNPELQSFLTETRAEVEVHLNEAKTLQAALAHP